MKVLGERLGSVLGIVLGLVGNTVPVEKIEAQVETVHAPRWEISAGMGYGTPRGWVQVREDTLAGTRLSIDGSLHVPSVRTVAMELVFRPSERASYSLAVTAYELDGSTVPPAPVYFNGTTLAAGATLATRTRFSNFIAARVTGVWRVGAPGGGDLRVRGGLSFVGLTFVLEGTLAAGSNVRETQEAFVAQELPVPIVGVDYGVPLGGRVRLEASVGGGYLPWMNSFRREGGTVTISQSEGWASLGARFTVAANVAIDASLRYATLGQHEKSTEDGNDFQLSATTVTLALVGRF